MLLADQITMAHARNGLDSEGQRFVEEFVRWCARYGERSCPAAPATVAAFIRSMGASKKETAAALEAITELHDSQGLSNPVATAAVRAELSKILGLSAPTSWRKSEQLLFAELPPEIRAVLARRELDRDKELRRLQSKVTELIQRGL